jgi:hypothetical protein
MVQLKARMSLAATGSFPVTYSSLKAADIPADRFSAITDSTGFETYQVTFATTLRWGNPAFAFPLVWMLIVSLALSLVLYLIRRFF